MIKSALFIFRQDLRLHDNTGFTKACEQAATLLPICIIDTTILSQFVPNDARRSFLASAISSLDKQLREKGSQLMVFYGDPKDIIPQLVKKYAIDALYRNESYGIGSTHRDARIQDRARKQYISCVIVHDFLLVPIGSLPVRKVFTPFFRQRQQYLSTHTPQTYSSPLFIPPVPIQCHKDSTALNPLSQEKREIILEGSEHPIRKPADAQKRIDTFDFFHYDETRNFPAQEGSSGLSIFLRFGIISIREVYHVAQTQQASVYISELAWREFRQHIFYHFPYTRTIPFQEKRRNIQRQDNESHLSARKNGMTGYPLVDAGMRQLQKEHRMHNRVRMVVASFLTKDLLIDWQQGEKYFAQYLLDYDTNVNTGNWQRSASIGADPKPLRIFSPIRQSERFDPTCAYIKKWLPELSGYTPKEIHNPQEYNLRYASPIIDHAEQSKKAKELYKSSDE